MNETVGSRGLRPRRISRMAVTSSLAAAVSVSGIGIAFAQTPSPSAGVEVRWQVVDDWGSGFQAAAEVVNLSGTTLDPWQVDMAFQHKVGSAWDANTQPVQGGFRVSGPSWAKSLSHGSKATFGLVGTRNGSTAIAPTGCVVAGTTCVVTGEDVPEQPTPTEPVTPAPEPTVPTPAPSTPAPTPAQTPPAGQPALTVELDNTSDWGSGRTVNATVKNSGSVAASSWQVSIPWSGQISAWSAQANVTEGTLVAKNVSWNGNVAPGGSATFGFNDTAPSMSQPGNCTATVNDVTAACTVVVRGVVAQPTPAPTQSAPTAAPTPAPAPTESDPAPVPQPTQPASSPDQPRTPAGKKTVAYYTAWSTYGRNYQVSQIPANQLTHINYAFANVANGQCVLGDPYADTDKAFPGDSWETGAKRGNFNQLNKLKAANPGLETLISVGGWTWSENFSDAASTPQKRQLFAESCADFMLEHGFDGLDIDWEYPVSGGLKAGKPEDKRNYTLLLQAVRAELDKRGAANGGKHYLLTIAAPAGPGTRANLEASNIGDAVDWINVMTYDLHGPWNAKTGHNAPLSPTPGDPDDAQLNVESAIDGYLNAGVAPEKLVLGVAFYGHSMAGVADVNGGLFQNHTGAAPGTWEKGSVDYKDIVDNYLGTYTRYWDADAKVPYLYNPATKVFISYDDPQSMSYKSKYIAEKGLGGGMFWELSADTTDNALLDALNRDMG